MALIGYMQISAESRYAGLQEDAPCKVGCKRVFKDIISGAKEERQGLDAVLTYLREGNAFVVWKLDRLNCSMAHLVNTVQSLAIRGVGPKILMGQGAAIDTTTVPGKLVFGTFAAFAELECDLIRERTKVGLTAVATHGHKGGCKPVVTVNELQ